MSFFRQNNTDNLIGHLNDLHEKNLELEKRNLELEAFGKEHEHKITMALSEQELRFEKRLVTMEREFEARQVELMRSHCIELDTEREKYKDELRRVAEEWNADYKEMHQRVLERLPNYNVECQKTM